MSCSSVALDLATPTIGKFNTPRLAMRCKAGKIFLYARSPVAPKKDSASDRGFASLMNFHFSYGRCVVRRSVVETPRPRRFARLVDCVGILEWFPLITRIAGRAFSVLIEAKSEVAADGKQSPPCAEEHRS